MEGFSYKDYDGLGLAQLVKAKEVQPKELVEAAIERIEQLNPQLNAVINKMYDKARQIGDHMDLSTPFAGVPILLKDIQQAIEGEPLTAGSKAFYHYRAKKDSEYTSRIKKTGAIIVGQTNVPEFALMGVTEPRHYGPTRNPWHLDYTPGGSSGGSAVAVATGIVPIAGANDGGGSIRIPGAYSGLFGLKPTRGRTPVGPLVGRNWQGASVEHVLTRSVRDSAAMLDNIGYPEKGAAFIAPPFKGSYLECAQTSIQRPLRIAYTTSSPMGTAVDDECVQAVLKAVSILESMGHIVAEKDAPVDGKKIAKSYMTMYFGEVAATLASYEEDFNKKVSFRDVEPTTWLLGLLGKASTTEEFVLSLREWDKAAYIMEEFHESYDFYFTPTTAFPPSKIGELDPKGVEKIMIEVIGRLKLGGFVKKIGIVDQIAEASLMRTPFTQLANLTGQPAMTVPLYLTKEGLPIGVQFMAAKGREDLLYQLAGELELTEHWLDVKQNPLFAE